MTKNPYHVRVKFGKFLFGTFCGRFGGKSIKRASGGLVPVGCLGGKAGSAGYTN